MDINLGGNNSMKPLTFIWTAKFKGSGDICQFDFETGKENRFQLVKEKFDSLEYFILWNKEKCFTVDLINGLIYFNTELKEQQEILEKDNCRLIFFRRHKVEMTENNIEKSHIITYHLGFQYNDQNGNNQKIILQIDSEGSWILGDN
jgi:hypothetical protein